MVTPRLRGAFVIRLERGPVALLDVAAVDFGEHGSELEAAAIEDAQEYEAHQGALDLQVLSIAAAIGLDPLPPIDDALAGPALALDAVPPDDLPPQPEGTPAIGSVIDVEDQGAFIEIPGEAWALIPAPVEAPPEVPYDPGAPGVEGLPAPPPLPVAQPVTVELVNLTRPGNPNFAQGDAFEVRISGPPNTAVTLTATQNGEDRGLWDWPGTDGEGHFILDGTMGPDNRGDWVENWKVGEQFATPTLIFKVF